MKYKQFIELVQDDDIEENVELCLKYLKEMYTHDKTNTLLIRLIKKNNNCEYLLPDIIKLLSHCEREGY